MDIQIILLILVCLFSFSIGFIVFGTFLRRWIHKKQYTQIDHLKSLYQPWVDEALSGNTQHMSEFQRVVDEDAFGREALEQIVCEKCMSGEKVILPLIQEIGFVRLYEKKLLSKHLSIPLRSRAADRLGRMQSEESVDLLFQVLKEESDKKDLANSIIKAMALIGSEKALESIITLFPLILKKEVITPKNGEMILIMFAPLYREHLVKALHNFQHSGERLSVIVTLDALSRSAVSEDMVAVAMEMLASEDAEIRVRCLRLIANANVQRVEMTLHEIRLCLQDRQWFIRLQAIEVARRFFCPESLPEMVLLLRDAHWQVRRAAAGMIVSRGDESLETIIGVIEGEDIYAKEAICEAIHLEGYVHQLINHLTQSSLLFNSSARILFYMHSIGLSSSLKEVVLTHPSGEIRQNLHLLIHPQGGDND